MTATNKSTATFNEKGLKYPDVRWVNDDDKM